MQTAPIALFVYNRPEHTRETLNSLSANHLAGESELFIFSDGPKPDASIDDIKKIDEVRKLIREKKWCGKVNIVESETNMGLVASIINGVTRIVNRYGRIIVLEDDLISSKYFLKYINDSLNLYEAEEKVISIAGYCYAIEGLPETFFLRGADCLGWATWKRGWELFETDGKKLLKELKEKKLTKKFDFNGAYYYSGMLESQTKGKVSSWAILWHASGFLKNKLTLFPGKSLIQHIGGDLSGTNFGDSDILDVEVSNDPVDLMKIPLEESQLAFEKFEKYLKKYTNLFNIKLLPRRIRTFIRRF